MAIPRIGVVAWLVLPALLAGGAATAFGATQVDYTTSQAKVAITSSDLAEKNRFELIPSYDSQDGRKGFTVGQIGFGDVAIVDTGDVCEHVDIANTEVCTGQLHSADIRTANGDDRVEIKFLQPGVAISCVAGVVPPIPLTVTADLGFGDDILGVSNLGPNTFGCFGLTPTFSLNGDFLTLEFDVALTADGGPGDDQLFAGSHGATLKGGSGKDTLQGGPGPDILIGGTGPDEILGGGGFNEVSYASSTRPVRVTTNGGGPDGEVFADGSIEGDDVVNVSTVIGGSGDDTLIGSGRQELDGGPGADTLQGGGSGPDQFNGGPGSDTVSYVTANVPVVVTVGHGVGDDGRRSGGVSEGDTVSGDVEVVVGSDVDDTLSATSGDRTLRGGKGNDDLSGGTGDDTIDGGAGSDDLSGGEGADHIIARDGVLDRTISCGPGIDTLEADLVDTRGRDCETRTFFATDDGPPGRARRRALRLRRDGSAAVAIACPARARVRCRGVLSLVSTGRRPRVLASAAYAAGLGRTVTVPLKLGGGTARALLARGTVLVRTVETGRSRKGPRRSLVILPVAGPRAP